MNQKEVVDIIDDRISQRFESFAQTMNALHKDSHDKILKAVETQIKTTVNGKIDKLNEKTDKQDIVLAEIKADNAQVKTILEERKFITQIWAFLKFLGGVMVSIGGAIILYKNIFK